MQGDFRPWREFGYDLGRIAEYTPSGLEYGAWLPRRDTRNWDDLAAFAITAAVRRARRKEIDQQKTAPGRLGTRSAQVAEGRSKEDWEAELRKR